MDFFTVPTLSFVELYCSFIIAHDPRRILHFNVTQPPTQFWVTSAICGRETGDRSIVR